MINPNKSYKASESAEIIDIDTLSESGIVTIQTKASRQLFRGSIARCGGINWKRFRPGDRVKFRCTFSIVSDCFVIDSMRRINRAAS